MRINKYISTCGVCSRRQADALVAAGRVTIDGVRAEAGAQVGAGMTVCVDGTRIAPKEHVYLLYYKPAGVICTADRSRPDNILDAVGYDGYLTYAGRLDVASEGLMLLTDDGDLIHAIMRAGDVHEKEYEVLCDRELKGADLAQMAAGVKLAELDRTTRPCRVERTGARSFRIILTEGMNRQIRRMCEAFGYEVRRILRTRIMDLTLEGLRRGETRPLTEEERTALVAQIRKA